VKYRVVIEQDEDGMFVAEVPALPGCISQGNTREEALGNIQEAITVYLESLKAHNEPIPPPINEEVVEVALWAPCPMFLAVKWLRHCSKLAMKKIDKKEAILSCGKYHIPIDAL
jgi:predicted RNase H-like HicB family nuclease